jgi:hypothetical protein
VDAASLTALLRTYVFPPASSPLEDVRVSIEAGQLRQQGTLHKVVDIPFTILASPSVTADGRLRLHPTSIKAAGIPAKGLMEALNLELDELLKGNASRGLVVEDNDLVLQVDRLGPPPKLEGRLVAVRVTSRELLQVFDSGRRVAPLRRTSDLHAGPRQAAAECSPVVVFRLHLSSSAV